MAPTVKEILYKVTVSILFGIIGFFSNFHTIMFPCGDYTVALLMGLLFPLLIALSWGWRYGTLSAVFGGCQSMWWLWGPSNGYAVFLIVPPFTLWIMWHGLFAALRRKQTSRKWWLNMYVVEVPFRILSTLNLLILARWAIHLNTPTWDWAVNSSTIIPIESSLFFAIKQACCGIIILLLADILLNVRFVRGLLRQGQSQAYRRAGHVINIFLLVGCLFWLVDSFFYAYQEKESFYSVLALDIPNYNLFTRFIFLIFCAISGLITSNILRKQREGKQALIKAKKEAIAREHFLKTLFTAIPDLIWVKDSKGRYLSCNARFERFFGAKEKEIFGKTDYDFVDRELANFFRKHDKNVMDTGRTGTNEEEIVFADDGHREHLETTKTPLFDKSGQLLGVLGIGRNITERVSLQAQLSQAQKMESVGRLAGGVAHDYNNISSIIIGYSELALEEVKKDDSLHDYLIEILTAAKRSTAITRQLLAFARKQAIAPKIININNSIQDLLNMLRRLIGEDILLTWLPGSDVWPVRLDPTQVDQIMANLCINARDAITDVGKVSIETENVTIENDYCVDHGEFTPGDFVLISVSDDGSGMTPETREKIFEPFFTTKSIGKGTGMGLATVYGIVKQNEGFVYVYSELGEGTTKKIYLPRHDGQVNQRRSVNSSEIPLGRGELILLVEDDETILKLSEKILQDLDYRVLSAITPTRAVEIAKEYACKIDLLITDVVMPEMNGRELSELLQKACPALKTLYVSGYTADVIANRGILDEGVFFISKPFSINEYALKIREVLSISSDKDT